MLPKDKLLIWQILLPIIITILFACKSKDNTGNLYIYITANYRSSYTSVEIFLEKAQLLISCDSSFTHEVVINKSFDLMTLKDYNELIASIQHEFKGCYLEQIRLIVPRNGTVILGRDTFPLEVPSGAQTGLKGNVNKTLQQTESITLVFNLDNILIRAGNKYIMTPQLEVIL